MPDIRESLTDLREAWEDCTQCELGEKRLQEGGRFVFGEGALGGVMFIGEGPGVNEEASGRPFIGESGKLLREAIEQAALNRFYISNIVACRSSAPAYDNEGQPIVRKNRVTKEIEQKIDDRPPTPAQLQACLPRLHEEIYRVDPILIVGLGASACKTLQGGKAVAINKENGVERAIEVPGASFSAVLTKKKRMWLRRVRGELRMPVEQNMVRYLMIPLIHPAAALRASADQRPGSPMHHLARGMMKIKSVYERIIQEVYQDQHPDPPEYIYP